MSKKDYVLVASVIAKHVKNWQSVGDCTEKRASLITLREVAVSMTQEFGTRNPAFRNDIFMDACGL